MASIGYIQVHAFASVAQIPLEDVSVAITAQDGTAIALRLTDRSGKTEPVGIPTPDLQDSQSPGSEEAPFTTVIVYARHQGFEQFKLEGVQVFADTTTLQELEMIPLAELPAAWDQSQTFETPPQNL